MYVLSLFIAIHFIFVYPFFIFTFYGIKNIHLSEQIQYRSSNNCTIQRAGSHGIWNMYTAGRAPKWVSHMHMHMHMHIHTWSDRSWVSQAGLAGCIDSNKFSRTCWTTANTWLPCRFSAQAYMSQEPALLPFQQIILFRNNSRYLSHHKQLKVKSRQCDLFTP